jgi:hypothetical protein
VSDWIGLGFIVFLVVAAIVGLKILSKPRTSTSDEFERRAAEEKTMLGASMSALQELMDPREAKARETIEQMKDGRYLNKRKEGKAGGNADEETDEDSI